MSNAIAWVLGVSAICTALTSIAGLFFTQERKVLKLKHDNEVSKVQQYLLLSKEQAEAMAADRNAAKVEVEKELYKMRRY